MNIKSSENRSPKNNIGKSKYLWKAIKSLGLPNKSGGYIVFIQTWQGIYCQNFRSLQIDIQLNLSHYLSLSENFKLDSTTEGYLFNILKKCRGHKSSRNWPNFRKIFKRWSRILAKPISELCNLSAVLGSFPDACKIAKVKPLFKKGSKTDPSNYRPISLLPLLSKVF